MPELIITVNCESMLISTGFFRFCKAVEHFYYVLLFTSGPYVGAGAQPWLSWLEIGFHLAAREAPPAARDADRLHVDARPGRTFEIKASSANVKVLEKLRELIRELDRVRKSLGAGNQKDRLQAIVNDQTIGAALLTPLKISLTRNAIGADAVNAFSGMIHRGLLAVCDKQITSIATGWN